MKNNNKIERIQLYYELIFLKSYLNEELLNICNNFISEIKKNIKNKEYNKLEEIKNKLNKNLLNNIYHFLEEIFNQFYTNYYDFDHYLNFINNFFDKNFLIKSINLSKDHVNFLKDHKQEILYLILRDTNIIEKHFVQIKKIVGNKKNIKNLNELEIEKILKLVNFNFN